MECVDALDVMGEAIEDALTREQIDEFAEHIGVCPSCANYYRQLRITRVVLGALPTAESTARLHELLARFREEFHRKSE